MSGPGPLAGSRIMLVTDDVDLRDLSQMLFEWYGATATIAPTVKAVDVSKRFGPDLILVDLPFDRREVFALVPRLRHGVPIVAVTKHGYDHPEHEARRAGFDLQMSVPLDPDSFERALAGILRKRAA